VRHVICHNCGGFLLEDNSVVFEGQDVSVAVKANEIDIRVNEQIRYVIFVLGNSLEQIEFNGRTVTLILYETSQISDWNAFF
jgi:hypothetical protein